MITQKEWNETTNHLNRCSYSESDNINSLYILSIEKMKKVGEKVGYFLDSDYVSAQLAVMNKHPKAKLAIGFKFLPDKTFINESVNFVSDKEWNMWQKQVPNLCGKYFNPEIYAIPQKYIIPV